MPVAVPFEDWIVGVFDPTVEDPWPPPAQELEHLTRLFSDPLGAPAILDRWLRTASVRDPRLRPYAEAAQTSCIQ